MDLRNICLDKLNNASNLPIDGFVFRQENALPFCPTFWHEELLLAKALSGSCLLIVDGVCHNVSVGDVVVLPPFSAYTMVDMQNFSAECCFANLRALQNSKNVLSYPSSTNMDCVVRQTEEKYLQICQAMVQLHKDRFLHHMCLIDIQNILHWLHHRTATNNITLDKQIYAVKNALNILHTQTTQIVVSQVAEQCGYSEFYLMKLVKRFTGYACVDYAINYKLTQIAIGLLTSDQDFCALAKSVGFANISYCNRQFKKMFATTPKEFRKRLKSDC